MTVFELGEVVDLPLRELHLVVDLILVRHIVDEAGADGVFRKKRAVIDEGANFLFGLVAAAGNAPNQLFVQVGVERLRHLTMGGGEGVLREGVGRRLVLADVQRIGERADLVERAPQKELVVRHAGQVERRGRHQEHFVAGAGEVELLFAAVLQVPDDRLARSAEVRDRVPDLLDFPPECGFARWAG